MPNPHPTPSAGEMTAETYLELCELASDPKATVHDICARMNADEEHAPRIIAGLMDELADLRRMVEAAQTFSTRMEQGAFDVELYRVLESNLRALAQRAGSGREGES